MWCIILIAPWAGLIGSFSATAMLALIDDSGSAVEAALILPTGIVIALIASIVTVPTCLIVGAPIIYAFRRQLRTAPWRWSLFITLLGTVIGAVLFGWTVTSSTSSTGIMIVLLFSATSSMSFALLYGLRASGETSLAS